MDFDILTCIPILYLTYLVMEILEDSQRLNEEILCAYSKKYGPLLGGILGVIPQCGISGAAAALYSTGTVTLGTMLAVFFATSDEMLPIMIAALGNDTAIGLELIVLIVLAKAGIGILLGYISDIVVKIGKGKNIHAFCAQENCKCEDEGGNVFVAALVHTLKISAILIAVYIGINLIIEAVGIETLSGSVISQPVIGNLAAGLFGLIPNCSISIILTQSYLSGIIDTGCLFSGLLSNAGIGLIVLFRANRNTKENFIITGMMLGLSVITGLIISIIL